MLPTRRHSWANIATTSCPVLSVNTSVKNLTNNLWIKVSFTAALPPTAPGVCTILGNGHSHFAHGNCRNRGLPQPNSTSSDQLFPDSTRKQNQTKMNDHLPSPPLLIQWENCFPNHLDYWSMNPCRCPVLTLSIRLIRTGQVDAEYESKKGTTAFLFENSLPGSVKQTAAQGLLIALLCQQTPD